MAGVLNHLYSNLTNRITINLCILVRHGHHLRGKPPGVAKSLKQRLEELNYKDPTLHFRVDIGLPIPVISRTKQIKERLEVIRKQHNDKELEKLARNHQLQIDLDEVNREWFKTNSFYHIKQIADHYGIFEHLFGDAYFHPVVPLSIHFVGSNIEHPVYFGNIIKPSDATEAPIVNYPSHNDTYWTLILTNPDGNFVEQNNEYVHWFKCNIPGSDLSKGETIVEYLQPFPPKGTGYHRFVFVLYKQDKKLDLAKFKLDGRCLDLTKRTFSTLDFYRDNQDNLTPGGLAFFQSDWDKSLTDFYHNTLNMKEPRFEYDFPPPYIRKQEWFPLRKPFNLYMDKYRDPKQINKEFLLRKLKNVHPFKAPPPALPYPNAVYFDQDTPSWLKLEMTKSRLKWGRINDIEQ